jgi:serine/threonine protein kinase
MYQKVRNRLHLRGAAVVHTNYSNSGRPAVTPPYAAANLFGHPETRCSRVLVIVAWLKLMSTRAVQALLQLAGCLASLHRADYVHRDIKPGSVIWLPSERRWALINFCRTTRPGDATPVPCSLGYAAPEIAAAAAVVGGTAHCGGAPAAAAAAADAWALGVIAFELFSRKRAFDVTRDPEHVRLVSLLFVPLSSTFYTLVWRPRSCAVRDHKNPHCWWQVFWQVVKDHHFFCGVE